MGDFRGLQQGEDLLDLPYLLADAIGRGLTYLNWEENLAKDKRPPRWMWGEGRLVSKWFEENSEDGEDSENPNDRLYIPDSVRNDAAKQLISD